MNRMRVPRQHRRYSLPSLSHNSLGLSRAVPEGSDTFQKALEELYSYEPHHVPPKETNQNSLNGLSNIQEGDEDAFAEEEEEVDPIEEVRKLNRRHSSPSCYVADHVDGLDRVTPKPSDKTSEGKTKTGTTVKKHANARKEYFVKHGHWPEERHRHVTAGRQFSMMPNRTQTSIAFGTSGSKPPKFTL